MLAFCISAILVETCSLCHFFFSEKWHICTAQHWLGPCIHPSIPFACNAGTQAKIHTNNRIDRTFVFVCFVEMESTRSEWESSPPKYATWVTSPFCYVDECLRFLVFFCGRMCEVSLWCYNVQQQVGFWACFLEGVVSQNCVFLHHGFALCCFEFGIMIYEAIVLYRLWFISMFCLSFRRCSAYAHWWPLRPSFGWHWSLSGFCTGRWNTLSFSGAFMSQMERTALAESNWGVVGASWCVVQVSCPDSFHLWGRTCPPSHNP